MIQKLLFKKGKLTPEISYQEVGKDSKTDCYFSSPEELQKCLAASLAPEIVAWLRDFPNLEKEPVLVEAARSKFDLIAHKIGCPPNPNRWEISLVAHYGKAYNHKTETMEDINSARLAFNSPFSVFIWSASKNTPESARVLAIEQISFRIPDHAQDSIPGWYLQFSESNGVYQPIIQYGGFKKPDKPTEAQLALISQSFQIKPLKENWVTLVCRPPLNVDFSYPVPTAVRFIGQFP